MSTVFANSNAIACKAGDSKVIAAFPDVCLSPPSPPAGPVPIPYPNTSFSKDMQNGSKTVMIGGQEVMLKDQSFYATSPLGDEAATNGLGASVVTHVITGKTYFAAWSMDVQFEGANVDRNLDLTGSNCASGPPSTPPMPDQDDLAVDDGPKNKGTKCTCCGGEAHTKAQQYGQEPLSEAEFYGTADGSLNPSDASFLRKLKTDPKCKHLLPGDDKKCNKYYPATKREKDAIETSWDGYRSEYKAKMGLPAGSPPDGSGAVAHRVPKAAGGCPTGDGNLAPTGADCKDKETRLSAIQDRRANYFRNA